MFAIGRLFDVVQGVVYKLTWSGAGLRVALHDLMSHIALKEILALIVSLRRTFISSGRF